DGLCEDDQDLITTRLPAEAAYLLSQRGHDAVSLRFRTSFILAPQDGIANSFVVSFSPRPAALFLHDQRLCACMAEALAWLWWIDTEFCHLGSKGGRSVN